MVLLFIFYTFIHCILIFLQCFIPCFKSILEYNTSMEVFMIYEDFVAERISQLRNHKNVSAREMSLAIGQNANYINRIENKLNLPSLQGLFYICEYFKITPQEFFTQNTSNPHKIQEILSVLNELEEDDSTLVLTLARALHRKR